MRNLLNIHHTALVGTTREGRAMHKGQQTKTAIIDVALSLATQMGLEGLTIGAVAEMAGMSKSGVFAHFGSREELQISVIREYHHRFEQEVFYPVLLLGRGLPRLRALFGNWMQRTSAEIDSGCLYISGAAEFDDRPGPVRDALASSVQTWMGALHRAVHMSVEQGDLDGQTDASQMSFEIHGLILACHYEARFLKSKTALSLAQRSFEQILRRYGADKTATHGADDDRQDRLAAAPASKSGMP
jgi:AcrR family transcriptional regulator